MTHTAPESKPHTFPHADAAQCACCGLALSKGGYDVPFIGVVGPKCVLKFVAFAEVLKFIEGRAITTTASREFNFSASRVITGLRVLGFEVSTDGGTFHVARRTRRLNDVVKSWKKVRAEFERDLKAASGLEGQVAA
ncbi:hypothetical protein [Deinococcus marmoris]|uniref:Uncharacterized protein n=1 Tax=Deinococcus marmoris TaxID=249408 RepID=A0A1U7P4T6_9DEIO|nr:hypothetical protein [Deinococcus marmoris]OLV20170.1 hypothetical protein BOO71_0000538 [Deinococcus marmoris]